MKCYFLFFNFYCNIYIYIFKITLYYILFWIVFIILNYFVMLFSCIVLDYISYILLLKIYLPYYISLNSILL